MSKNKLNLTLSPDSTISATPSKTEYVQAFVDITKGIETDKSHHKIPFLPDK